MNIVGQDSDTDYNDVWVLDFCLNDGTAGGTDNGNPSAAAVCMPEWTKLEISGTVPEVRYGGHGGVYPSGTSFWLGFGFNKKEETGKRLGNTFRIRFTNSSTTSETHQ